uniref:Uncharacterized protein n=1 Tax=Anguilla anguilla TaxID=7936 RepID=A0A0E9XJT4_ANGAN
MSTSLHLTGNFNTSCSRILSASVHNTHTTAILYYSQYYC